MRIQLCYIGKPRSQSLNAAAAEYAKRLQRYCRFEMIELRREKDASEGKALRVVLDPAGRQRNSREFAAFLETAQRDVSFFVGGADGFSEPFRARADELLSLSLMTLPHELARVVLTEQIYRAFTLLHGHPYPR